MERNRNRQRILKQRRVVFRFIVVLIFCGNVQRSAAQSIRISDNNLDNSPNLSIGGSILGLDLYDPNLSGFLEGRLNYRIKKERGWIGLHYKAAWADRWEEVGDTEYSYDPVPEGGSKPMKNYGIYAGFNFIRKEEQKITRATIMNRNRSRSLRLPVKSYRLYGFHVGYEHFRSIMAQGSTMSFTGHIVSDFPKDTIISVNNATPMLNMKIISVGIHRQFLEHSVFEARNNGGVEYTKSKFSSMVYADFLIGTNILLEDILVPLGPYGMNANSQGGYNNNINYNFYRVNINGSYNKAPVGGRLGWEYMSLGPIGVLTGLEIGFRPGIVGPGYNTYALFRLGMMFNMKAK